MDCQFNVPNEPIEFQHLFLSLSLALDLSLSAHCAAQLHPEKRRRRSDMGGRYREREREPGPVSNLCGIPELRHPGTLPEWHAPRPQNSPKTAQEWQTKLHRGRGCPSQTRLRLFGLRRGGSLLSRPASRSLRSSVSAAAGRPLWTPQV